MVETATAPSVDLDTWQKNLTVQLLNDAFQLGSTIAELQGRITIATALTRSIRQPDDVFAHARGNPLLETSVLRSRFLKLASIQMERFGDIPTTGTYYQPEVGWGSLLPYIADTTVDGQNGVMYYDIGIPAGLQFPLDSPASAPSGDAKPFSSFGLYDATRRVLNCLCLLLLPESADPDLLTESLDSYRKPLLAKIGDGTQDPLAALQLVSDDCGQLLDAWHCFIQEYFYSGEFLHLHVQSDSDAGADLELVGYSQTAYEAGRSLTRLSWDVQASTIVPRLNPSFAEAERARVLYGYWSTGFAAEKIAHAQHQLTTLAPEFDHLYAAMQSKQAPNSGSGKADILTPGAALLCLNRNLLYWQRTLQWLGSDGTDGTTSGQAASASGIAQPQSGFVELEPALMAALREQSDVWRILVTMPMAVASYSMETVMQAAVQEVIAGVEQEITTPLSAFWRRSWWLLTILVLAILVPTAVAVVVLLIHSPNWAGTLNPNGLWGIIGIGPLAAAVAGIVGVSRTSGSAPGTNAAAGASESRSTQPVNAAGGLALAGNVVQEIASGLEDAWQRAINQVRSDLATLNHEVGISYPLFTCMVAWRKDKLQTDYDFMKAVIWSRQDRQAEVLNVVRTTLGPFLGLIRAQTAVTTLGPE